MTFDPLDRVLRHIEDIHARTERLVDEANVLLPLLARDAGEAVRRFAIQLERLADHVEGLRADLELA